MRTIEGYDTDWDDGDQIGAYDDDGIESFVVVGYDGISYAFIDIDADGEGPGVVLSGYQTRDAAVTAATVYLSKKEA
jgi:GH18 family chitinase